jgi:hypothetical protein
MPALGNNKGDHINKLFFYVKSKSEKQKNALSNVTLMEWGSSCISG